VTPGALITCEALCIHKHSSSIWYSPLEALYTIGLNLSKHSPYFNPLLNFHFSLCLGHVIVSAIANISNDNINICTVIASDQISDNRKEPNIWKRDDICVCILIRKHLTSQNERTNIPGILDFTRESRDKQVNVR
jgi:hypothetical protein